ncbi:DnaJ domain-containing protein [Mycoplana ramosa]|uniref:DnaJ domain-containing protein n=1 Tax=Mycoplana ramosa TaxID=40837 RepID=A0ABW3YZ98_MYCRA
MTLYEILNVPADCTGSEIEEAYRARQSRSAHSGPLTRMVESLQLTAEIDYAHSILSDARRRHYDKSPCDFLEFHLIPIVI